tara:strand:+ start:16366 stop:16485 length:120 start_codon:yes stop_codon:yes gene_type:complete
MKIKDWTLREPLPKDGQNKLVTTQSCSVDKIVAEIAMKL